MEVFKKMTNRTKKLVTFWIDPSKIGMLDEFSDEIGIQNRTQFIIDSMMFAYHNPEAFKKGKIKSESTDTPLLKKFIGAFLQYQETGEMPELDISDEEMNRFQKLAEEVST